MAESFSIRRAKQSSVQGPAALGLVAKFWAGLTRACRAVFVTRRNVAEAERLLKMSDRALDDIGLTRAEIYDYILRNDRGNAG
ncbi:MAG: DUF1127 domain-containing protein [Pseudomonadota bacterium]